jgi:transcriptional regulator with XRE-family HTH domain
MVTEPPKLVFGTSAKSQVGQRLKVYISESFAGNCAQAAKSLGMSRQRLSSYTTGKSFPGADVIDMILEKWHLDLLGTGGSVGAKRAAGKAKSQQVGLFDKPVTLTNDQMTLVIERKGPGIEFRFEVSARAKLT